MFDHLLESSRWDDSSKWSNIEFGQEIDILEMKIRKKCWQNYQNKFAICGTHPQDKNQQQKFRRGKVENTLKAIPTKLDTGTTLTQQSNTAPTSIIHEMHNSFLATLVKDNKRSVL